MRPDLKTWICGQCERTILVPPADDPGYADTLRRIGEHRLGHMVDALMHGSDEDLWGLCGDDVEAEALCWADEMGTTSQSAPAAAVVDSDDLLPVLAGIEGLLRDDLPRARRVWYPIRDDGSFNREED